VLGAEDSTLLLGEDFFAWAVLAIGGAMAIGNLAALVRPPATRPAGSMDRPPVGRSVLMALIGAVAAVWALASLTA
jgi:hypothetical protein